MSGLTKEQLTSIDTSRLSSGNYTTVIGLIIGNALGGFVSDSRHGNLCYSYMHTKINPKTGKDFTLNEILLEDPDEINEQKILADKEICRIFSFKKLVYIVFFPDLDLRSHNHFCILKMHHVSAYR